MVQHIRDLGKSCPGAQKSWKINGQIQKIGGNEAAQNEKGIEDMWS